MSSKKQERSMHRSNTDGPQSSAASPQQVPRAATSVNPKSVADSKARSTKGADSTGKSPGGVSLQPSLAVEQPSGAYAAKSAAAAAANSNAADGKDGEFDIFLFLNDDKKELLRDPVLQQMTVVRYEGEIDHPSGFFHGHGKMVSTLGYTYSGAFQKGLMHGQGRIAWTDGTTYEGEFVDNTISGNGKYTWPNGDWYDGDVRLHVRHGKGRFHYKALDETYEGDWREGLRHGKGVLKYSADGSCQYEGEWHEDRRKGHGVMRYGDGSTYDGEWLDDVRHGQGHMTWRQNGFVVEEYKGSWVKGTPSGTGVSTYIRPPQKLIGGNGAPITPAPPSDPSKASAAELKDSAMNTYTGEYLDGKRHGFGTFVYDDGSRYEGQWCNNLKHGPGKYTSATGVVFVGTFVDGNPEKPIADVKPETTVACPVPLYIRDLLAATEANENEAMVAVQSVVSRNHGQLRKVFKYYSSLETGVEVLTTPPDWRAARAQGTMYLVQFLRMCSDCKLITQHLTIVEIDRLLLAFRDRHESTTSDAYLAGNAAPSPVPGASSPKGGHGSPAAGRNAKDGSPANDITISAPPAGKDGVPLSPTTTAEPTGERKASDGSRGRRSTGGTRGSLGADAKNYAAPWDRYRQELHGFVGELNFREFVEAVVRVASALYRDPVYGSLANKVQIVLDEHLAAFACQPANGAPLFRLCREQKSVLLKYVEPLRHCFEFYARASAMGSTAFGKGSAGSGTTATSSGHRVKDLTVTVRQLSLMLKACGLLRTPQSADASTAERRVRLSDVLKAVPYDRHEGLSAIIYKKAFIKHYIGQHQRQQSQLSGLVGGGGGGPSGTNPSQRPPASTTPSHAPSHSVAASQSVAAVDRQSTVSGVAPSVQSQQHLLSTIHSTSNSIQSIRDEEAQAAITAEAEAALASKLALQAKSRGPSGRSFRTTVAMDIELTFVEFVEALAGIAAATFVENNAGQRISSMMLNYILPHEKDLPPVTV